jgi:hypothetical protein
VDPKDLIARVLHLTRFSGKNASDDYPMASPFIFLCNSRMTALKTVS